MMLAVCAALLNWFAPAVVDGLRVECGTAAALLVALSQPLPAAIVAAGFAAMPALAAHHDPFGAAIVAMQCLAMWAASRRLAPFPSAILFWACAAIVILFWKPALWAAVLGLVGLSNALLAELWLRTLGDRWNLTPAPGASRVTFKALTISVLGSTIGLLGLILLVLSARAGQRRNESILQSQLRESVAARCDRVDAYLDQHVQAMKTLAGFIEESGVTRPEALSRLLARTRASHPGFSSVGIASEDGFVMARAGKSASDQPYSVGASGFFSEARSTGKVFVSSATRREDTGETAVTVASPVWRQGKFSGIVEGTLDPFQLQRALSEGAIGRRFPFRVIDSSGNSVVASAGFSEQGSYTAATRFGDWRVQSNPAAAGVDPESSRTLLVIAVAGIVSVLTMVPFGTVLAAMVTSPLERLGRKISAFHHAAAPRTPRVLLMASPEEVRAVEHRFDEMSSRLLRPAPAADSREDRS